MLITFTSKHSPDVVMFGDSATSLLRAMGVSDTPPGILRGEDTRQAADRLREYLKALPEDSGQPEKQDEADQDDEEAEEQVGLQQRAAPLLQMLDAAYREGDDVIWR